MSIEYSSLRRVVESEGALIAEQKMGAVIEETKLKLSSPGCSLKGIYEAIVGESTQTLSYAQVGRGFVGTTKDVREADVKSSAFSNIIGHLIANELIDAYETVPRIGDRLVRTPYYRTTQRGERYVGFSAHETIKDVDEGEPYEEFSMSDKYVTINEQKKRGGKILVTEEAILDEQTGMLVERVHSLAERVAEAKEKNIIRCVVGELPCYFPNGTQELLYQGAPYLVPSNALVNYTNIEKAEIEGFSAMVDEEGEKIGWMPAKPVMLVPRSLYRTGKNIVTATQIEVGTDDSGIRSLSLNPMQEDKIQVLTSNFVHFYTGNTTSWFFGDPKRQFRYKEIWPLQVFALGEPNSLSFDRDIKFAYKVREWGYCFAVDNKYFVKNDA